jgi:CBS domain-containing protein
MTEGDAMRVRDTMTRDVITVTPTTLIHEVASLMANHGVSGLPVLDEKGSVVGIVTEADLLVRQKPRTCRGGSSSTGIGWRANSSARSGPRPASHDAGRSSALVPISPSGAAAILHEQKIRRVRS